MLDDDRLAALLAHAGAAFDVPASGPDEILARVHGPASEAATNEDATTTEDGTATAVPSAAADGVEDADQRAEGHDDLASARRRNRVRRMMDVTGRHRLLSAAACVAALLIVAGSIDALVAQHGSQPAITSSLGRSQALPPAARTPGSHGGATTTVPRSFAQASPSQQLQQSPAKASTGSATPGATGTGTNGVTAPSTPPLPSDAVGQSAKIEQTGTLGLTVGRGELSKAMTRLSALAGAYGGFVANSQTQTGAGPNGLPPSGSITLQVPVDSFSAVLKQAQTLGKTSALTTKATDVTGQYVDLQARISALEASRQQYLTILSKATTVGDVLSVQEQIDGIQTQIEQLQGQLQVLTSETSYSTLSVTVSEGTPPPRPPPLPESGLVHAWHDSVGGFVAGVEGVIRLAGPVLFALLCLAVLVFGGRSLWRRYQRHNL